MMNLLSSLISRTMRLASIKSSKALGTFLIATLTLDLWSYAEHTTPYAPCPICLMYSNLSSTTKVVPAHTNEFFPLICFNGIGFSICSLAAADWFLLTISLVWA